MVCTIFESPASFRQAAVARPALAKLTPSNASSLCELKLSLLGREEPELKIRNSTPKSALNNALDSQLPRLHR